MPQAELIIPWASRIKLSSMRTVVLAAVKHNYLFWSAILILIEIHDVDTCILSCRSSLELIIAWDYFFSFLCKNWLEISFYKVNIPAKFPHNVTHTYTCISSSILSYFDLTKYAIKPKKVTKKIQSFRTRSNFLVLCLTSIITSYWQQHRNTSKIRVKGQDSKVRV